jgi:hypothetical protein
MMAKGDRAPFLGGGSHSMHSAEGVGKQKPGVSSQEGSGSMSGDGSPEAGPPGAGRYSSGATNKDYAGAQTPGVSAATKKGGNSKWAEGGSGKMFGFSGSKPAVGGRSGQ